MVLRGSSVCSHKESNCSWHLSCKVSVSVALAQQRTTAKNTLGDAAPGCTGWISCSCQTVYSNTNQCCPPTKAVH